MLKGRLGAMQLDIMKVLWARGEATARDVTDALADAARLAGQAPPAHSTVQTLLRKMEAKGAVAHDGGERVFVFRPVWREEATATSAARDLLSRVFHGSLSSMVSHLLVHEAVDPAELARLRRLIDEAARRADAAPTADAAGGPGAGSAGLNREGRDA